MKKIGLAVLLTFLTFQSYSQSKNFIDQPYLETTATVDTLVIPDRIYLSIQITEKDTKNRTSVEELENRMNDKLNLLGIDTKKQLTLSDVATNFESYFLRGTKVLKNKNYTLVVHNAVTAGKVIVALESIEISNVDLDKLEYSKIEELKIKLKQKAVAKAKKQAESMLKPLNQTLGKAIYISDQNSSISNSLQGRAAGIVVYGYSAQPNIHKPIKIEFEKIEITSTVTVNFKIE